MHDSTTDNPASDGTTVLPYPNGWFAVAFSTEVRPGQVITSRLMGKDVVIFRTRSGTLTVVDPHCPHLGAHLGRGGRMDGENLVCPFHAFAFNSERTFRLKTG
ncbi:Rieske 2Fe-2S domain-containing protein [Streptomyces sp. NBC_00019]|uniref:Rieske 2Fe-2S domain-containing protein n=1 Tax=Streptomyces sp. NBC_00019 TaxID=2975623 RepID=UPI002F90EF5D